MGNGIGEWPAWRAILKGELSLTGLLLAGGLFLFPLLQITIDVRCVAEPEEASVGLVRGWNQLSEHGSRDDLYTVLMHARTLERDKNGEILKWVRSIIEQWPAEDEYRKNAEELIARAVARLGGAHFEGDIETTPRQIHHNILTSAGIDPTKEPWVSLIDLAIMDEDPTRVLIDCEHKVIMHHPDSDPMLDRLGLERANSKIIGCNVYGYALGGPAMDDIDQEFKRRFCSTCLKRSPRPAGWIFDGQQTGTTARGT